jgi:hypothetical protein
VLEGSDMNNDKKPTVSGEIFCELLAALDAFTGIRHLAFRDDWAHRNDAEDAKWDHAWQTAEDLVSKYHDLRRGMR